MIPVGPTPSCHGVAPFAGWRVAVQVVMMGIGVSGCAVLDDSRLDRDLPNQVAIGERIVTAGQPSRVQLSQLRERGFDVVLHIVVERSRTKIDDESELVMAQGVGYVRIPVDADSLRAADVRAVANALHQFSGRRVLVHCERNFVSSTLVFLYRVVDLRQDVRHALDDVERVWMPNGRTLAFMNALLREQGYAADLR